MDAPVAVLVLQWIAWGIATALAPCAAAALVVVVLAGSLAWLGSTAVVLVAGIGSRVSA